ncbi:hypothetical protein PILCRDRAFT_41199, partial [Piloderma croceum F 1598]
MNTVNASTGFSGFQLHLGQSPHIILPIVPNELPVELQDAAETATTIIDQLKNDVAKITQVHHSSGSHAPDPLFHVDDLVMLSTANRCHKYKKKGK